MRLKDESITIVNLRRAGIILSLLFPLSLMLVSVEGIFVVTPKSKTVILDRPVIIKCQTDQSNFRLLFRFNAPPGQPEPQSPTINNPLPNGGTEITITFNVTKELNATTVICIAAAGATFLQTSPATIYAYALQEYAENFKACQLNQYVFISWNPVFAIEGISITYRIMDNKGLDNTTSTPYYSFDYNATKEYDYTANVSIIANATAANQISYSNASYLAYKLNATKPLNLTYDKDLTSRSGEEWRLFFQIKLHHLDVTECIIDEETLRNATLVSCNGTIAAENCTNSTSVDYTYIENHHEINSINDLSPRQKYNSTLCFPYLGREIISQQAHTSTHDIQDINDISQNDTSLCLRFHLIHHYKVKLIHLHIEREEESIPFNVNVPENMNKTSFEWCAKAIPATSSNNNGNWSLFACDGREKCNNPAVILNNILLNVVYPNTSSILTNTTTRTMHTTTASVSSYSMSVFSSSTSLPTEATTDPSLQLERIVSVVAVVAVIAVIIIIVIIVLFLVCKRKRNTKITYMSD